MKTAIATTLLVLLAASGDSLIASAQAQDLVTEELMIPSTDPGIELYIRSKRPKNLNTFHPANIVLFVHGATFPSETSFDLELDGTSWMDYIARRGYDTYLVDVRGYGKSTRPAEMNEPASENPPLVRTETAAQDYSAAVDFILKRRNVSKLNVLGWSWGTSIAGLYASQNSEKVNRLVLYAPVWLRQEKPEDKAGKPLDAYRIIRWDAAKNWVTRGVPANMQLMPDAWREEWLRASFASDPIGATANPKYVRAPSGSRIDRKEYWSAGKSLYNASKIRAPTLIILGEWDVDTPPYMAQALYKELVNAASKRLVVVKEGTHALLIQKSRLRLFEEVQQFLDDSTSQR